MGKRIQNITGCTPQEIADFLIVYKDTVQIPIRNVSDVLMKIDKKESRQIVLVTKGDSAIMALVE